MAKVYVTTEEFTRTSKAWRVAMEQRNFARAARIARAANKCYAGIIKSFNGKTAMVLPIPFAE